jgi:Fe-S-cluster containining protein
MTDCKRCGECCRYVVFGAAYGGADWNEYYFRRGCKIIEGVGLMVPSICPHLKKHGDRFECDIYDSRPVLCRTEKRKSNLRFYKHPGCTQL